MSSFCGASPRKFFYRFREMKRLVEVGDPGEYFASIKDLVDEAVAEYRAVSRHVELLEG